LVLFVVLQVPVDPSTEFHPVVVFDVIAEQAVPAREGVCTHLSVVEGQLSASAVGGDAAPLLASTVVFGTSEGQQAISDRTP
jgi:hypothetical protein